MASAPGSPYRKSNWLAIYENHCFIARNYTSESLLIGDSIIEGLTRYKGTWCNKYLPNSINFGISKDRAKSVLWRALNLPDKPYLTNVIILCGTNNICNDSLYDIAQFLIDINVCFRNSLPKAKIFISGILPRDKCNSVNKILMKEINTTLKRKGWTDF